MSDSSMTPEIEKLQGYSSGTRNVLNIIFAQTLIILGLAVALIYNINVGHPSDRFFAETASGGRMQLASLSDPNLNNEALLAWASQATVDVLTFGFHDVDARFEQSKSYFSPKGWKSFLEALTGSSMLKNMLSLQQIATAIPAAPPILMSWGPMEGKYTWIIQVPISMTTRAGANRSVTQLNVVLTVVQMPTSQNPRGLGIENWMSI
jgi:intracellular multiplication protein IcmL